MSDEKVLTKEVAEEYLNEDDPRFQEFTAIEDEAAEVLGSRYKNECQSTLYLNGLTSLSDAAAKSLAEYRGYRGKCDHGLFFLGLESLSDAAARRLSRYNGTLNLDGLSILSDAAAESLSECSGWLSFCGLRSLTDSAAQSLSMHKGFALHLDGLTTLSDAVAESLSKYRGDTLTLSGLTSLSDAAAESLGKCDVSFLTLNGVTSLSDVAAKGLTAGHFGQDIVEQTEQNHDWGYKALHLEKLANLSERAASEFSRLNPAFAIWLSNEFINSVSNHVMNALQSHQDGEGLALCERIATWCLDSKASKRVRQAKPRVLTAVKRSQNKTLS